MATKQGTENALIIERTFDAPRELVFKAWTEPEHVLQWLGPKDFTAIEFRMDDAGGTWASRMRGPDGKEYANGGRVLELREPECLRFTFKWDDGGSEETTITIHLEEVGAKTTMTFHQATFETTESRDGHRGGWSESFDKLEAYLAKA